jgi:hypothetical protein
MGDLDTYLKITKHDIITTFCAFISHTITVGMGTCKPVPVVALSKRGSAAACLLGLWVRNPPGTWMSVYCECCVLSGRGLLTSLPLVQRSPTDYVCVCVCVCVCVVCDLETSWTRRPWSALGLSATKKKWVLVRTVHVSGSIIYAI